MVAVFDRIEQRRPLRATIKSDNGGEFTSELMLKWSAERKVDLDFTEPGKPNQNASIESFNGRMRDELLNTPSRRSSAPAR